MKNVKTILCLISLLVAGITNVWGEVNIGDEYSWNSTTNTLTINKAGDFADGEMGDYTSGTAPWYTTYSGLAEKIVLANGIKTIGNYAFHKFTKATSIDIPSSVTSIGQYAFNSCSAMAHIKYGGTPTQWASIDFEGEDAPRHSHPFGSRTSGNYSYYFYGGASATTTLVIEPTIDVIPNTAFFRGTFTGGISIPGTVETIDAYAFYGCSFGGEFAVNRSTAPAVTENAFKDNSISGASKFYYPVDATGYDAAPWNSVAQETEDVEGTTIETYGTNVKWDLSQDGVLTLDATNGSKSITCAAASHYPWRYFRRLVNSIVLKGEIESLDQSLRYLYGISEVIVNQATIPTISSTYIATGSTTPYNNLFNKSAQLKLTIKPAALASASASNLGSAPWNEDKWDIQLLEDVTVDETDYNAGTMLRNIHKYIEKNINLKFDRANMKNTYFNTFCSPIPLSAEEVSSIFGEADIRTLTSSSYDEESQTLTLNFSDPATPITTIDSGVPYLIQPEKEVNFSTITFENLAPSKVVTSAKKVTGEHVNFYGTLGKVDVTEGQIDNASFLFLLADNKLTYAT